MNKNLKLVIGIIIAVVTLWGIMFLIDSSRVANLKEPIFVIKGKILKDGGSYEGYGLGYKVEVKKRISAEYGIQLERVEMYMFNKFIAGAVSDLNADENNENESAELGRIVMVDRTLYYDTGEKSTALRCGMMDGKITSNVANDKIPTEDNESNFEGEYAYQWWGYGEIQILIDDEWCVFKAKENDFTIKVYDKSLEKYNTVHTILDKDETDKYDYNIYAYKVSVNIVINGEEISLKNALLENKITMDEIIAKANKDFPNAVAYKDGGSVEYHYDLYTIIKLNKIDGNKDIYIGMSDLNMRDLEL